MDENKTICPGCGRGCAVSEPGCPRGEEYARTGVLSEGDGHRGHGQHGEHRHRRRRSLVESPQYAELDSDGKLFTMLMELGHFCRFGFEGKGGQGRVLRILAKDGELNQRELTERLGIQPGSASELLGKLERAGLIERREEETDRRTAAVHLTDAGRERSAAANQEREARIRTLFSALSGEEKDTLLSLTEKLYASWREQRREHPHGHKPRTEE
ncbi:MAG: winged helix-turn-helix transcriptional regulator [Oscillospiraceae bacterium]|nr:winged helix-turn-helix transcriptional regulator [Oscillospiraceae bacterium]